jgi:hypothetical protein
MADLHPHEIINQLRRVLALLEVTHHEALKLRVVFEEADNDLILELTDVLALARGLVEDHDELEDDGPRRIGKLGKLLEEHGIDTLNP